MTTQHFRKFGFWIVFLVPFAIFLFNLDGTWILDDHYQLEQNPFIRSFQYLGRILTTRVWQSSSTETQGSEIYRPVFMLSYMIDYAIFGLKPLWFHLVSNLIHCANVLLLYVLAVYFFSVPLAIGAALLFAIHPMMVEPVTWIAARTDLLATFFALVSLHSVLKISESDSGKKMLWIVVFLLTVPFGIFSKEIFTPVPFVALGTVFLFKPESRRTWLSIGLGVVALTGLCLQWRQHIVGNSLSDYLSWGLLRNFNSLIARFAYLFVNPTDLDFFNGYTSRDVIWKIDLLSFLGIVLLMSIALWLGRKKMPVWLGLGIFVSALLPVMLIIDKQGLLAERYYYLPFLGAVLVFTAIIEWVSARVDLKKFGWFFVVWLILLGGISIWRNREWRDEVPLYASSMDRNSNNYRPYFFMAWHYYRAKDIDSEVHFYYETLKRDPDNVASLNNLVVRNVQKGNFKEAERILQQVLRVAPWRQKTAYNAGFFFEAQGKNEQALKWYKKAVQLDSNYQMAKSAVERLENK